MEKYVMNNNQVIKLTELAKIHTNMDIEEADFYQEDEEGFLSAKLGNLPVWFYLIKDKFCLSVGMCDNQKFYYPESPEFKVLLDVLDGYIPA
jgi:hypothetical protein